MIKVNFSRFKNGMICRCVVSGHAGYAEYGSDVVCASVSSAVQLTANLITESFNIPADVSLESNKILIDASRLSSENIRNADLILKAFEQHIYFIKEEYPEYINIEYLEV